MTKKVWITSFQVMLYCEEEMGWSVVRLLAENVTRMIIYWAWKCYSIATYKSIQGEVSGWSYPKIPC